MNHSKIPSSMSVAPNLCCPCYSRITKPKGSSIQRKTYHAANTAFLQYDASIRRLPLNRDKRVAVFEVAYSVQQTSQRQCSRTKSEQCVDSFPWVFWETPFRFWRRERERERVWGRRSKLNLWLQHWQSSAYSTKLLPLLTSLFDREV